MCVGNAMHPTLWFGFKQPAGGCLSKRQGTRRSPSYHPFQNLVEKSYPFDAAANGCQAPRRGGPFNTGSSSYGSGYAGWNWLYLVLAGY